MTRVMGIDYGDRRVGIALSDPLLITAQPYSTIERRGGREVNEIVALIQAQQVTEVIVGYPLELDGDVGEAAANATRFALSIERVAKRSGVDPLRVIMWDERFTTDAAERIVIDHKLHGKERAAALDRVAAALILDAYLEYRRRSE